MNVFNNDISAGTVGVYFNRQLQQILTQTYDVRYPEFKYSSLFPIATEGADLMNITWYAYDQAGFAKIITANSKDIPRVDLSGYEQHARIQELATSYGYTLREMRIAQKAGIDMDGRKAAAAKRAIDKKINDIALIGDEQHGLTGFLNAPNVPVNAARLGRNGSSDWTTKTPDEILADLNELVDGISDLSYGLEEPDTLLLPKDKLTYIRTTPRKDNSDTSIWQFFQNTQPTIKNIDWLKELKGAGPGGSDMMIAYSKDPNKLVLRLPKPFEQLPVERSQLEYEVICLAQCGGITFYYPLSCARTVGI